MATEKLQRCRQQEPALAAWPRRPDGGDLPDLPDVLLALERVRDVDVVAYDVLRRVAVKAFRYWEALQRIAQGEARRARGEALQALPELDECGPACITGWCAECALPLIGPPRAHYCSERCGTRKRNRGRQRVGKGLTPTETSRHRLEERLRRHFARCGTCGGGDWCPEREAMFYSADALAPRRRVGLDPEAAEAVKQRTATGRTAARGVKR